jgi:nitric oxide reductase subunit C
MLKLKYTLLLLVVIPGLLLVGCGGGGGDQGQAGESPTEIGDPERGRELFNQATIGPNNAPGCITCHSLEPDVTQVGPSQADAASRAAETVASQDYSGSADSAQGYLRESIVEPDAHVTEGFSPGVMYQNYEEDLTEEQINDLVAFLMTLE